MPKPHIERWWRVVPANGQSVWTDQDPTGKLGAAWEGATVHGPFVLDADRERYEIEKERDELRALCEMVDAHYSGSLDSRPGYVKRIREALGG